MGIDSILSPASIAAFYQVIDDSIISYVVRHCGSLFDHHILIFDEYSGDNHRRENHDVCTKFHLRIYKIISDVFALGQHRLDQVQQKTYAHATKHLQ